MAYTLLGCSEGNAGPTTPEVRLDLELVASGLASPVFVTAPPGDTARLFVVEKEGRIRVLRNGTLLTNPFLDIGGLVSSSGEQGLLSMAFHPEVAGNGEFFVDYTDVNGDTRVVRYRVSVDPDVADPTSAEVVLTMEQPFSNHNGGLILFGPDGMLYVGLGDGGSGGDPQGHGQNAGTLLGSLLRIDVDGGTPYAVPADNPFVGDAAARREIWAYGLRNPWRFSFDWVTGDLYIADVGQNDWEEVDVEPGRSGGGVNYGWNIMEAAHCFSPSSNCDSAGLVLPVLEYSSAEGCSVIGGYVYRGSKIPGLVGHYLYSDFCSAWVRSFRYLGGQATDLRDRSAELRPDGSVSSFGEDARGELYITTLEGNLFRVVSADG